MSADAASGNGSLSNAAIPCLVYCAQSYSGRGPAESCVQIVKYFRDNGLDPTLFVGRARTSVPPSMAVQPAVPAWLNYVPWRLVQRRAIQRAGHLYAAALAEAPVKGIAYFWPNHDLELVQHARNEGWIVVREMTNRTLAAAKASLDRGFAEAGEARPHHIPEYRVVEENAVLREFDLLFSSNADVDASLLALGIDQSRILPTSFGWPDEKFGTVGPRTTGEPLRVGYLGTLSIGKGIPDLLDAWKLWRGEGTLELAGPMDWSMDQAVASAIATDPRIRHLGYVTGVQDFFNRCDIVVIPTLDEGGPQVTYEAAATAAAIIGTPMARARMLEHERNALIVPCHDAGALAAAIARLAARPDERRRLGEQARRDVLPFAYSRVGSERARMLAAAFRRLTGKAASPETAPPMVRVSA